MGDAAPRMTPVDRWPSPDRKRRFLAWYLDYLLFGAPWALVVWALSRALPDLEAQSWVLRLVVFSAIQVAMLKLFSWSPGHWLAGIRRLVADPLSTPGSAESREARYVVDPWYLANERRWTQVYGVLAILNGVKSMVRWTMWAPAAPFMGSSVGAEVSALIFVAYGVGECVVGGMALRLDRRILGLGAVVYGANLMSLLLSWSSLPAYIEAYAKARRAYQGLPVKGQEVELAQRFMPAVMVVAIVVMGLWMCAVARHARQAREATTGSS